MLASLQEFGAHVVRVLGSELGRAGAQAVAGRAAALPEQRLPAHSQEEHRKHGLPEDFR